MRFYLGTHEPNWLKRTALPLFLSRRRLARLKTPIGAGMGPWALDSGGFSELFLFGRWETSPARYAEEALRWRAEIGRLDFAAVQDWMCEPFMLAKTGLSVAEHQARTVQSSIDLAALAPDIPWAPVLQGWEIDDYLAHAELYRSAGVDLSLAPVVGVGSVCRRQATRQAADLFAALAPLGLPLHGFGLKTEALRRWTPGLASADSMAWSFRARRSAPLPGCRHASCANCFDFATAWREDVLRVGRRPKQMSLAM